MTRQIFLAVMCVGVSSPGFAQDCGWVQRTANLKPPRAEPMAFDTERSVSVMFVSVYDGQEKRGTWEWNAEDWLLRSDTGPSWRVYNALAYHPGEAACVLFGGQTADTYEFETWTWDGLNWENVTNGIPPGGRSGHGLVYDEARDVLVMFGGLVEPDGDEIGDTWEWDGARWKNVSNSGPEPRAAHSMAYDPERGVTVLYGGFGPGVSYDDTWEWDGIKWTEREEHGPMGTRSRGAMVYSNGLRACVFFGGQMGGQGNNPQNDTWLWDGQAWTELKVAEGPKPRTFHALAYDSTRDVIVLFGGESFGQVLDDTWELVCAPPCYPDFDGDGDLTFFDFLAFTNAFNAGEAGQADCDKSQSLDFFDFLCFVNAFNAGC